MSSCLPRFTLAAVALALAAPAFADDALPPKAPRTDLVTDYSGVKVADPFRGLEDLKSPQVQAWAQAQAAYTRRTLDALPGLQKLRDDITALDGERPPVLRNVQVMPDGRWFYEKRLASDPVFKLYVRDSAQAPERVLLDPVAWKQQTGHAHAINNFTVSPDGKHMAAVVSVDDAELGELRLYDVASGRQVREPVPGIWGELPAIWHRDSRSVDYVRGIGALQGEPFGRMRVYQRQLGAGEDRPLIGFGLDQGPEVRAKDWVFTDPRSAARWTVAVRFEGIGSQARIAVAPSAELQRDPAHAHWRALLDSSAGVDNTGLHDHWLYARSFVDAPRYHLLRYDLAHPGAKPVEVVPQARGVIDGFTVAADGLYYVVRTGSLSEVWRLPHGAKAAQAQRLPLPYAGAVSLFDANPDSKGVVFTLEGWTHERSVLRYDGRRVSDTGLVPATASTIGSDWVAEEATCRSHDGVEVPMSVLYKRGLKKDGSHPAWMRGYGGYGFPEQAYFDRKLDAWLQRGGVFVDVDPRGGGAYGREWYQAGVGPRKSNTWKDMIACGQALVERGYTSPGKLAIEGTSMGGVAVGRAVTERPDLFAVGIVRVGITEAVRFIEATDNGPNHEDEMGSVKTADGVRQLLAMSTYHQIRDGEKYPAMLFTAGMNDHRVAPWITFKTFARMSEATGSGKPVLLRVESEGGHGVNTTAQQRNAELADRLAFILWNTGDPAFQPAVTTAAVAR
jgi:prolyl oligopeptidase